MLDEKELIKNAQNGDNDAFGELVKQNQNRVYFTALKLTGNPADAEDIASQTFVVAFKNIRKFEGRSSFSTWLYRICFNVVYHHFKKRKIVIADNVTDRDDDEGPVELVDKSSDPYEKIISKEREVIVRTALSRLSKKYREILLLREIEGLNYDEISASLNISRGTVMSRLHRARQKFRKILEGIF